MRLPGREQLAPRDNTYNTTAGFNFILENWFIDLTGTQRRTIAARIRTAMLEEARRCSFQ